MGYREIQGTSDIALSTPNNTQEHLLQTVADLTVLHEELSLVLFILDKATKLRKEDGSLATLLEIFTARQNGPANRMSTLELVMTGKVSRESSKPSNRHDSQYSANAYNRSQDGSDNPSPYIPNSYGQVPSSQSQYGASQSRYEASRSQNNEIGRSQYGAVNAVGRPLYSNTQSGYGQLSEVYTDHVPSSTSKGVPSSGSKYGGSAFQYSQSSYHDSPSYSPSSSPRRSPISQSKYPQNSQLSNQHRDPPSSVIARSPSDHTPITSTPLAHRTSHDTMSPQPDDLPPPIFDASQLAQMFKDKDYPPLLMVDPTESLVSGKLEHEQSQNSSIPPQSSFNRRSSSSSGVSSTGQTSFSKQLYQPFAPSTKPSFTITGSIDEDKYEEDTPRISAFPPTTSSFRSNYSHSIGSGLSHMDRQDKYYDNEGYHDDNTVRFDGPRKLNNKPAANHQYRNVLPTLPEHQGSDMHLHTGSSGELQQKVTPRRKSSNDIYQRMQWPDRTQRPDHTQWPDRTQQPDHTQRPDHTQWPDRTQQPDHTQWPDHTQRSGHTQRPDMLPHTWRGESTRQQIKNYSKERERDRACDLWDDGRPDHAQWPDRTQQPDMLSHAWGGESTRQQIKNYSKERERERARDLWDDSRSYMNDRYTQSGAATRPGYNTSQPPKHHYGTNVPVMSYNRPPQSTYQTYMEQQQPVQTDEPDRWKCILCMQWNHQNATSCETCNQLKQVWLFVVLYCA